MNHQTPSLSLTTRRQFLKASSVLGALPLIGAGQAFCANGHQAEKSKTAEEFLTPEAKAAISKGLDFLARRQVTRGRDRGAFGTSGYQGSVGIASLGGLAFMSGGSTPGIGVYGKNVANVADFLVRNTHRSGYIARPTGGVGNMYGHAFAMLFLSQAYGMSRQREIGEKLELAVKCTLASQNDEGGWRYKPVKSDADLSVTVSQVMALRGARDAGLNVPDKVREKTIEYVRRCQRAGGVFSYQPQAQGGRSSSGLTAAGLVSFYSVGIHEGKEMEEGLAYLKKNRSKNTGHYYYANYYAVQAMWHAGGKWWNEWYPHIREELINKQSANGAWTSNRGSEYATAMACIILQMPNDMLPIFSR